MTLKALDFNNETDITPLELRGILENGRDCSDDVRFRPMVVAAEIFEWKREYLVSVVEESRALR